MATDEELRAIYRTNNRREIGIASSSPNAAYYMPSHDAAIRAVYNAGLTRAAEIARELESEAWSHDAARIALDRAGNAIEAERGQRQ